MTGLFILSLDTEIAWGTRDSDDLRNRQHAFNTCRPTIRRLLELLDTYEIPATWAIVGHLLLTPPQAHPDVVVPDFDWMDADGIDRDQWYYGADVIAMIRQAAMPHEIGTHTFSHVLARDAAVTPAVWDAELTACATIHQQHGLGMHSLIYPRNQVNYVETLPRYGIGAFRGEATPWYRNIRGLPARVCRILDRVLAITPPTYDPATLRVGEHLVNLPASQTLFGYFGCKSVWMPRRIVLRQHCRGLERAMHRGHLYHYWTHPFSLGLHPGMFAVLDDALQAVARYRDQGRLQVLTMQAAAAHILAAHPPTGAQHAPPP